MNQAPEAISADDPFERKYLDVLGSKMAYVDEGVGAPIVFLHGNPTSSYLWRNIIPHVEKLGRCIAPDLIGMGRSDKPEHDYRFVDHARYLAAFLDGLALASITFVVHDWGAALAFDWTTHQPERVRGLAFMEAVLTPVPSWDRLGSPRAREVFKGVRTPGVGEKMIFEENLFIEKQLPAGVLRVLTEAELDHYRAPFLDPATRKPMLVWPRELPIEGEPKDVVAIVERSRDFLSRSPIPKLLVAVEPGGTMPAPVVAWCRDNLPNLEVVSLGEGRHHLQEDHPHAIGSALAAWIHRI